MAKTASKAATRARAKTRTRAPDVTRDKLLRAAFDEIYERGFQAASIETIIANAGVTKGALYHHFPDKAALGYAVVDEVVRRLLLGRWLDLLDQQSADPITALQHVLLCRADRATAGEVRLGCPLNNLAQEMSPLDERFRRRVNATFDAWRDGFANAIERGQSAGSVRRDVDARSIASLIVAAIEGSFGLAKNAKSRAMLQSNLVVLAGFLESLRSSTTSASPAEDAAADQVADSGMRAKRTIIR